MLEPSLNNQLECTVVTVVGPVSGRNYFWNQQYQNSRFAKIVLEDKWNSFSILQWSYYSVGKASFLHWYCRWSGCCHLQDTHKYCLWVSFFLFLRWTITLCVILCCTLVFPDKYKRGSVLWCGKNLLMVEETLLKEAKKNKKKTTEYSEPFSFCDFLTARNCLPQDFVCELHSIWSQVSVQTISQPDDAIFNPSESFEAMTTPLLTSFRSYPSFQRHRRCFLISSRIPSIHSQKGKFLSFIFSWNSEVGWGVEENGENEAWVLLNGEEASSQSQCYHLPALACFSPFLLHHPHILVFMIFPSFLCPY